MRKRAICAGMVLVLGLWGCGERKQEERVAGVKATVSAGEFHNEVLAAFDQRAPLDGVTGMQWDDWQETLLASMEEVSLEHGISFDRGQASAEIMDLARVFHALEVATGIDPGMLRARPDPEADFATLVGQLEDWKLIDETTATILADFHVDKVASRAAFTVQPELRDVYEIGAESREFWTQHAKESGPHVLVPPDEDQPCKVCQYGSTLSDMLGAVAGRIFCKSDPHCIARQAATASIVFTMIMNYCADHNCNGDPWLPPILP